MPNSIARFFMGLMGRSWVYESVEDIREVIAKNHVNSQDKRARTHTEGAARLTDAPAFQPGLIDLHDELHETWSYLVGLADRAIELGHETLGSTLAVAATTTRHTLGHVATAAEATVPAPASPVAKHDPDRASS
ncbi:hypothetical protein ABZ851_30160 [Streptomyces sp. NPDC047049]|uniref:hypothetical protein n=1 Tax=Streptomyces sp. NPDC047049 TaxID=3156688 RepID=UPI003405BB13